jgi:hypothetical protein
VNRLKKAPELTGGALTGVQDSLANGGELAEQFADGQVQALLAGAVAQEVGELEGQDILAGHGVRCGKAMIATLRWRLIAVPGRLVRHARHLILRLPPGHSLLPEVLARLRELPAPA